MTMLLCSREANSSFFSADEGVLPPVDFSPAGEYKSVQANAQCLEVVIPFV